MSLPHAMASNFRIPAKAAAWAALLAILASALPASAQSITADLLSIGGELPGAGMLRLSGADCTDDVSVVFRLDALPAEKDFVDIYRGNDCANMNRDMPTESTCVFIANEQPVAKNMVDISLRARTDIECDMVSGDLKIWFVPVSQSRASEEVGNVFGVADLTVDTTGPPPPSNVEGGAGEDQIPVSWMIEGQELASFTIYIDSSPIDGDAGTGCGSDVLVANEPAPTDNVGYTTKPAGGSSSTGVDLSLNDINGDRAAVAIEATDIAGNKSVLSDVVCVEVMPTTSPWELYGNSPDAVEPGCPCAAMGPVHAETAWPVALALTVLALRRRRRGGAR